MGIPAREIRLVEDCTISLRVMAVLLIPMQMMSYIFLETRVLCRHREIAEPVGFPGVKFMELVPILDLLFVLVDDNHLVLGRSATPVHPCRNQVFAFYWYNFKAFSR